MSNLGHLLIKSHAANALAYIVCGFKSYLSRLILLKSEVTTLKIYYSLFPKWSDLLGYTTAIFSIC